MPDRFADYSPELLERLVDAEWGPADIAHECDRSSSYVANRLRELGLDTQPTQTPNKGLARKLWQNDFDAEADPDTGSTSGEVDG